VSPSYANVTKEASQTHGLHVWIWLSLVNSTENQFPGIRGKVWQENKLSWGKLKGCVVLGTCWQAQVNSILIFLK